MRILRTTLARLRGLFGQQRRDEDLDQELAMHAEMETEANIRAGMSPIEARRQALIHSGGLESAKEQYRARRSVPLLESIFQDVRYAVRTLRKSPMFLGTALATLALGIGANTAMFSLMRKALAPMDVEDPSRVVFAYSTNPQRGWDRFPVSIPDFLDWKATGLFSYAAAISGDNANLRFGDRTDHMTALITTPELFEVTGLKPIRGRGFNAADSVPGAESVAVIGEELWHSHFAGREDIIGQTAVINGKPCTIVGVASRRMPRFEQESLYLPLTLTAPLTTERGSRHNNTIGRLAPGVTVEAAQKRLEELCRRLADQFQEDRGNSVTVQPVEEAAVQDSAALVLVLSAAVGLVLLVACANLASLLLARGAARGKEIALRSALGAGRFRISRQLLTESLLLSIAGGALGLLPAIWGLRFIQSFPIEDSFDMSGIAIDWPAIAFTMLLSIVTGALFGLAPAIHAWRSDVNDVLKGSTNSVTRGGFLVRLRALFVGTEVAVAMVLLVAAGLLLQSLLRLQSEDPGYSAKGVLGMGVALSGDAYAKPDQQARFYEKLLTRIAALPGVDSVGAAEELPSSSDVHGSALLFPDRPEPRIEDVPIILRTPVSANYFATIKQPVIRGRGFTDSDRDGSTPVAVIDEYTAAKFWPGTDALGKRIRLGNKKQPVLEIVGIVANQEQPVLIRALKGRIPEAYLPAAQQPKAAMFIAVRTSNDPVTLAAPIRSLMRELDPDQPVFHFESLEAARKARRAPQQLAATLLDAFAVLAALLAAIGIYGVIAWHVTQRTREFGIRLSLGAQPREILNLAIRQGLTLAGLGIAVGLIASYALTRFLESLLHGIAANDPFTFAGVTLLFVAVAILSSWIPARRAARIDPSSALRA